MSKKILIDAVDVVDVALMLHSISNSGIFEKNRETKKAKIRLNKLVGNLQYEYKKQLTPVEMAEVSKKVLRKRNIKV